MGKAARNALKVGGGLLLFFAFTLLKIGDGVAGTAAAVVAAAIGTALVAIVLVVQWIARSSDS